MRKIYAVLLAVLSTSSVLAGGLVTNTNQSASFIRNPSRGASLEIDAAYFNPAGLVFLPDGFHFSVNNQTITQERSIGTDLAILNRRDFIGSVSAPLFPSVYAVYKINNLAFSFGFMPIGGGGSAMYEEGLPSFESQVAVLPSGLSAAGIPTTRYGYDVEFDGSSVFWGIQGVAAYKVNDRLSVSAGLRFITVNNTYNGFLRHVAINPNQPAFGPLFNGNNMVQAPFFFTSAATVLTGWSTGAATFATALNAHLVPHGSVLLANAGTLPAPFTLTPAQIAQIQGLITAAGQSPAGMTIAVAQGTLNAAAPVFSASAATMTAQAAATADREVNATQTGTGIAPIIGFTFKPIDHLVIGFKYEHKAAMTLTNETVVDGTGMFPDGAETPSDMPSKFSLGVSYGVTPRLNISGTAHYYLDRSANFGRRVSGALVENTVIIDRNLWEGALGLEFMVSDRILLSAGYLTTQSGVNDLYQTDLTHSLSTHSLGGGVRYGLSENLKLNFGLMNTWYNAATRNFGTFTETYDRTAFVIAVGVDFSF
jgi:long-subunit fatty acid transport protein